uniref:Putative nuclease HARBI1 n=1 Tax=Lygus hesperus TaxID=30085 RepID=A0A0A9Z9S7_LYGHE
MGPRRLRHRVCQPNFDTWSKRDFFQRFRLSKEGAAYVLNLIRPQISADSRGHPVSPEEKLLTTLSFYASGAFFSVCGDRHDLPKATVCRIVHQVSDAIARLANRFICMPQSEREKTETRKKVS